MSLWHLEPPATGCGGSGRMLSPLTRALSHLAPGPCWDPVRTSPKVPPWLSQLTTQGPCSATVWPWEHPQSLSLLSLICCGN